MQLIKYRVNQMNSAFKLMVAFAAFAVASLSCATPVADPYVKKSNDVQLQATKSRSKYVVPGPEWVWARPIIVVPTLSVSANPYN